VLRVDEALAEQAVRSGGRIAVLCAAETTMEPTRLLFEAAAARTASQIAMCLVPGAWAAFRGGDQDRYFDLIAQAAEAALRDGAKQGALAQASMAGAAKRVRDASLVLTSPAAGLGAAIAKAGQETLHA
jgi:hypothetical protein